MARGINKVIIVGNLGNDPDCKYMPSGGAVTNITVATSESWKDKQTGQPQERTEWHRVVFFNKLAEIAGEYLKKGSKVYVEGQLRTRKWDKDGTDMYTTEIVARDMQMLDSRNQNGDSLNSQAANQHPHRSAPQKAPQVPRQAAPQQAAPRAPVGIDDFDDDIPF